ncbi:RDD family protein [Flavobacterium sp.]|uniref:RDD family protein n=1 Tax=Flavobacterium sp. TaxID=239 RepID=UPI0026028EC6|nr:RDD family protein [Flavobacterium sp.]
MEDKQLPVHLEGSYDSIYGNFGYRFAALLLDGIILAPISVGFFVFNSMDLNNVYAGILVSNAITIFYHIYFPARFGATPGKLALGLHILKMNGDAITYSDAFRRYLPNLLLGLIAIINTLFAVSKADAKVYNDLSWMKQSEYLQSMNSSMFYIQMICINALLFTSFFIFISNERKRSISDLSGDTAVVKKYYLKQIKEVMK